MATIAGEPAHFADAAGWATDPKPQLPPEHPLFTKNFRRTIGQVGEVVICGFKIYADGSLSYIYSQPPKLPQLVLGVPVEKAISDPEALRLWEACCHLWRRHHNNPDELARFCDLLADGAQNARLVSDLLPESKTSCCVM